jgi:hypothetical protein
MPRVQVLASHSERTPAPRTPRRRTRPRAARRRSGRHASAPRQSVARGSHTRRTQGSERPAGRPRAAKSKTPHQRTPVRPSASNHRVAPDSRQREPAVGCSREVPRPGQERKIASTALARRSAVTARSGLGLSLGPLLPGRESRSLPCGCRYLRRPHRALRERQASQSKSTMGRQARSSDNAAFGQRSRWTRTLGQRSTSHTTSREPPGTRGMPRRRRSPCSRRVWGRSVSTASWRSSCRKTSAHFSMTRLRDALRGPRGLLRAHGPEEVRRRAGMVEPARLAERRFS